ncbi:MAG: tetratricopeptide repeat protein [Crocinitomicaceae bacterium]|nr:MAG: tetratricopeptide repeat protein [Crocinitomicaceae bacterium]
MCKTLIFFYCKSFTILLFVLVCSSSLTFSQSTNDKEFNTIKSEILIDIDHATKLTNSFNQRALEARNEKMIAQGNYLAGLINYYKTQHYISNKYYAQAIQSKYAQQDINFKGNCYNNMGINYEILNMYPEAIKSYEQSLRIAEKLGDSTSIGQSKINIGLLNSKINRFDLAYSTILEALHYFKRQQDSANLSLCYQNLTVLYSFQNNYEKAIEFAQKSLQISLKTNNTFQIANDYYNISNNYSLLNQPEKSDYYIELALQLIPEIGNREGVSSRIYLQKGNNEIGKGNFKVAENYLLKSLEIVKSLDISESIPNSYNGLIDLYAKYGDYQKYSYYRDQLELFNELEKTRKSIERVQELQALYEFDRKTAKIDKQNRELIVKQYQLLALSIFISVIIGILVYLIFIHIRMKRYMRSLFEQKLEQTKHESMHVVNSISEITSKNELLDLYNQIITFINERKIQSIPDVKIEEISAHLKADESKISKSIELFGNKDFKSFLYTHYIDEICKKMIEKGKEVNIRELVAASNFENYNTFYKKFKDITGLTPEQFIVYSQEKIDLERRIKSAS